MQNKIILLLEEACGQQEENILYKIILFFLEAKKTSEAERCTSDRKHQSFLFLFNRRLAELLPGCVQRGKPALSSALPGRPRAYQRLGKAIACIQISTAES